jgi:hypothetical protein
MPKEPNSQYMDHYASHRQRLVGNCMFFPNYFLGDETEGKV